MRRKRGDTHPLLARPGSPKDHEVRVAVRRDLVMDLRVRGYSVKRIAEEIQVSKDTVGKDIRECLLDLKQTTRETAEQVRDIEVARLDEMLFGVWAKAIDGDEKAITAALKIGERRAKLLGLDAPVKQELSGPDGKPLRTFVDLIREVEPTPTEPESPPTDDT